MGQFTESWLDELDAWPILVMWLTIETKDFSNNRSFRPLMIRILFDEMNASDIIADFIKEHDGTEHAPADMHSNLKEL